MGGLEGVLGATWDVWECLGTLRNVMLLVMVKVTMMTMMMVTMVTTMMMTKYSGSGSVQTTAAARTSAAAAGSRINCFISR